MPSRQILQPDPDPAVSDLADALDQARASSYPLTFAVYRLAYAPDPPHVALDALAAELGYRSLGEHWIEIPRRIALKLLTHLIGGELAYPVEVVPPTQAEELARRFLALFPRGARYFTNGAVSGDFAIYASDGREILGWRSLSEAPLDNGVVALGAERIALLWAEDAP